MEDELIALERARLAARLRETLIDPLALLLAQVSVYEQAAAHDERQRVAFGVLSSLARQALQRARDLEADLDDAALVAQGLETALELLVARTMRASPALVELSLPRQRVELPPALVRALLRCAQDTIARAVGPAYARRVWLRLSHSGQRIILAIADDGDPAAGVALTAVAERQVARLGGTLRRSRSAHGGLELSVELPLTATSLTAREQEVLGLLASGLSTRAIAAQLGLAPRTVTFHLANIYAKLGVAGRAEAIVAVLHGTVG